MKQNNELPMKQNNESSMKQNNESPMKQNNESPMKQNNRQRAPMQSQITFKMNFKERDDRSGGKAQHEELERLVCCILKERDEYNKKYCIIPLVFRRPYTPVA